jgi:uncharacterized phage infection (PIP) family protein YhgE
MTEQHTHTHIHIDNGDLLPLFYREFDKLREELKGEFMATSEEVQSRFDTIVAQLADLDTSVDTVLAARTALEDQVAQLNTTIAELQATATRLAGEDAAEDADFMAEINTLQGVASNLQAQIDATYTGLEDVSEAISAIDADVDGTSGEQPTGETPTETPSEPVVDEPVEEVTTPDESSDVPVSEAPVDDSSGDVLTDAPVVDEQQPV